MPSWWTSAATEGWALAQDMMADLWPVLIVPVGFAVVAFIASIVRGE